MLITVLFHKVIVFSNPTSVVKTQYSKAFAKTGFPLIN